jgi:hypothetical protein
LGCKEREASPVYRGHRARREKRGSLAYKDQLGHKERKASLAYRGRLDHREKQASLAHKDHWHRSVNPQTQRAFMYWNAASQNWRNGWRT